MQPGEIMQGALRNGCVAALVSMALAGCGAGDPGPASPDGVPEVLDIRGPDAFRLAPGQSARGPGGSEVIFVGVGADSRCPIDVVCVWQGNAEVVVRIRDGAEPGRSVRMGTALDPRFVDVGRVRLHLDLLEPSPLAATPVDPTRYRATFRLLLVVPGG